MAGAEVAPMRGVPVETARAEVWWAAVEVVVPVEIAAPVGAAALPEMVAPVGVPALPEMVAPVAALCSVPTASSIPERLATVPS